MSGAFLIHGRGASTVHGGAATQHSTARTTSLQHYSTYSTARVVSTVQRSAQSTVRKYIRT